MNAVVVDDQVDPISFRIPDNEQVQHLAEQRRVFVVGTRDVQLSGPSVQRTRQVELLVLAGGQHLALIPFWHPIPAYLRIHVDIDFVAVQHGLRCGCRCFQSLDLP